VNPVHSEGLRTGGQCFLVMSFIWLNILNESSTSRAIPANSVVQIILFYVHTANFPLVDRKTETHGFSELQLPCFGSNLNLS